MPGTNVWQHQRFPAPTLSPNAFNECPAPTLAPTLGTNACTNALHQRFAPAELFAPNAVIEQEQGGEDRAIALALKGILGRRFKELPGLGIAERQVLPFIAVGGPLDAPNFST